MNLIDVPAGPRAARPHCRVVQMQPPRGVSEEDCGTAPMLVQESGTPPIPGFQQGRANYAYYRPTAEELEQLNAGGFIEFGQYGTVVNPFSAAVWPADPPGEDTAAES